MLQSKVRARRARVYKIPDTPPKTSRPLPLDILRRIFSFLDPIHDAKARPALAISLRVSHAIHDLVAPLLYREVSLHWLVNQDVVWKAGTQDTYYKIRKRNPAPRYTLPAHYIQYIRHLYVHHHTHKNIRSACRLQLPPALVHMDILELEIATRNRYARTRRDWCNDITPHSRRNGNVNRCPGIRFFRPRTLLLICEDLFVNDSDEAFCDVSRLPEVTLQALRRLVIRPRRCALEDIFHGYGADDHLRFGKIPTSTQRIDVVFEPSIAGLRRPRNGGPPSILDRQRLQTVMFEDLLSLMFAAPRREPPGYQVTIVGIGYLGDDIDPLHDPGASGRCSEAIQVAVEARVRMIAITKHGDSPETRATLDKMRFLDLRTYAAELRGIDKHILSAECWNHSELDPLFET
ncbi:hypothetical protein BD324DRAFT_294140 [Kockovaella imperatae]|uniref:F-box domain-containing protein n=1 Tax=Kockovaella imperatae TaxID=4999 RepID=A0A1Y1ULC2_9TREE|nr:hypothetical protein BD324DRAFT_294140 [Kockovaella imperatae]ORX38848.1 hypothetical protein BD324DRAFT_294140 [Kockovaella imperatae]